MKFDITLKSKVLNLTPVDLDIEFIKKVVKKEKDTPTQYPNIFLLYGENGTGKTTLSECLRTNDENDHYNIEKIDLGIFEGSDFHVYNRHFVSQNIHDMNKMVNSDKFINVVIGQKTIALLKNLNQTTTERETADTQLVNLKNLLMDSENKYLKIDTELTNDLTDKYKDFLLKTDIELTNLIGTLSRSLPTEENAIPQNITKLDELPAWTISQTEITSLLSKKIRVLEKDREDEIFKFCNFLLTQREWYNIGLSSLDHTDSLCPFCHQSLENEDTKKLIEDYKIALQNKEITDLKNSIKLLLSKINKQQYTTTFEKNKNNDISLLSNKKDTSDINTLIIEIDSLIDVLQKKLDNTSVESVFNINNIVKCIVEYNTIIKQNNSSITLYNEGLETKRKDRDTLLINKQKSETEIKLYERVIENRHTYTEKLNQLELLIKDKQKYLDQVKQQKKELQEKEEKFTKCSTNYETQAQTEIEKYQEKINKILGDFNFNFNISTTLSVKNDRRSKQTVGDITAQYTIQRINQANPQNVDTSSLGYSLSEGEKNALGLAFFLAQLPDDMSNTVLVFDDPMTSFDINRANRTAEFILEYTPKYTLILTHHKAFASKIFYYRKGNVFCLKFDNTGDETTICSSRCFLEKDEFFEIYMEFLKGRESTDLAKQQSAARKAVELILTNAYLSTIKTTDKFSSTYEKIRFGKQQTGRNMSLVNSINDDEILKNKIDIFLKHYDWLSNEDHSSNRRPIKMDESELRPRLDRAFNDIVAYMTTGVKT